MKAHESKEKQEQFIEIRAIQGKSLELTSKELGIAKTTAIEWEKEFKDAIEQLKQAQINGLIDSFMLGLTNRIIENKAISESLRHEISNRDLKEVSTEKLISLFLETSKRTDALLERYNLDKAKNDGQDKHQTYEEYLRELTRQA